MPSIDQFMRGIQQKEGWFPGSRAWRNNNPGNLREWGSLPRDGGYAVFPNVSEGFRALRKQIWNNIKRGLTLYEFFAGKPGVYYGYSPASDGNDPDGYARFVSGYVNVPTHGVRLNTFGWTDEYALEREYAGIDNRTGQVVIPVAPTGGNDIDREYGGSENTPDNRVGEVSIVDMLYDELYRPVELPYVGGVPMGYLVIGGLLLVVVASR